MRTGTSRAVSRRNALHVAAVDRVSAAATIERVRWGAAVFVVVQFLLFTPSARAVDPPLSSPLAGGVLFAGALALVNLVSWGCRRGRDPAARMRAGGALITIADTAVLIALISYYSFDPDVRLWPMLVFPILEGAVLGGFGGAVAAWGLASFGYGVEQLVDGPGQGYTTAEIVPAITFASAVLATVAFTTGFLARAVAQARATSVAHEAQLAALVRVARELAAERSPELLLHRFVTAACDLSGFDRALLIDEDDDGWQVRATADGTDTPELSVLDRDRLDSLAGSLTGTRTAVGAEDVPLLTDLLPDCRTRAVAPVRSEGDTRALLVLGATTDTDIPPDDLAAVELLAGHAAVALENAELARARERTIAELEAVDRVKGDFMSILTHELRSPMTAVAGFADVLASRYYELDDEQRRRFLEHIATGVKRQSQLIGDVADALLAERTELPIETERVDLALLVQDAVTGTQLVTGTDRIEVVVGVDVPEVLGDASRIAQVVDNLLSNAVKYSPAGGPVEVVVERAGDDQVLLVVADRGLGIPPDRTGQLFRKFSRLHAETGIGGTGLGLYLCAQLVEAMDGTIAVEPREGGGTLFTVLLPAAQPAVGGPPTHRHAPSTADAERAPADRTT
jgi:signal transduction histidine kinase